MPVKIRNIFQPIRYPACIFFLVFGIISEAKTQTAGKAAEVEQIASRILNVLASDSLEGRGNFEAGLLKANRYITGEFKSYGLQPLPEFPEYLFPVRIRKKRKIDTVYNVIGILPGKSKTNEAIVISAHYDHMGRYIGAIMNGANDNASGTTGMMLLANFFARKKDNERTLIFCAFAAEELGLIGSQEFAKYNTGYKIVANINLEMIGIPQYGEKKIFITGRKKSTLPDILIKEFPDEMTIVAEPPEWKQLYKRSDNYSFAVRRIPAHTIMASDDSDVCYHKPCDEAKRIDIPNLVNIIKNLAYAMRTLVSGEATPGF